MADNNKINTNTKPTEEKIKKIVNLAISECYGVIGLSSIINKKGQDEEGIIVHFESNSTFTLDLYITVAKHVKLTESLRSCQKTVKFYMSKAFPKLCKKVNIYAEDISSL